MQKLIYLLFFIACSLASMRAQQAARWTLGAGAGTLLYQGDLSYERYPQLSPAFQFNLGHRLSPSIDLSLSVLAGDLYGNDRQQGRDGQLLTQNPDFSRALNFRSRIRDLSVQVAYRMDNGRIFSENALFAPYLFSGLGLTNFRVFADLYHGPNQDQRYHYWLDGTIRDKAKRDTGTAAFVAQDGNYETDVTNAGTEADGLYPTTVLHIPLGIGLRMRLSGRIAFRLSAEARLPFTDYLDDVSGAYKDKYPDEATAYAARPAATARALRGDPGARDWYFFPAVGMEIRLGKIAKAQSLVNRAHRDPDGLYAGSVKSRTEVAKVAPPDSQVAVGTGGRLMGQGLMRDTVYIYQTDTVFSEGRLPDTVYKYIVLPAGLEKTDAHASESRKALQSLYEKLLALNEEMAALKNRNEQFDQLISRGGPGATRNIRPDDAFNSVFAPPEKAVIYYGLGEYEIGSPQQQRLTAIVSLMEQNPTMGLLISGHADQTGDAGVNLRISRLRAEAAAKYIVRQSGIDPARIITRYYGEAVPPNFTGAPEMGKGSERRVELDFIKIK